MASNVPWSGESDGANPCELSVKAHLLRRRGLGGWRSGQANMLRRVDPPEADGAAWDVPEDCVAAWWRR